MTLGVNDHRATDLIRLIRTKDVLVTEVLVGDVVWEDVICYQVTEISTKEEGSTELIGDGNGSIYRNEFHVTIVDRSALRKAPGG